MSTFCRLNANKRKALVAYTALMASNKGTARDLLARGDFARVYQALSGVLDGWTFSLSDFTEVGQLSKGMQNVNLFLYVVDEKASDNDKGKLRKAFGSHCWDKNAGIICEKISDSSRHFSGSDLHQAYAPDDNMPCLPLPEGLRKPIEAVIGAGNDVGDFCTGTVPNFFSNEMGPAAGSLFNGASQAANTLGDLGSDIGKGVVDAGKKIGKVITTPPWKW